jgi:MFS family permease
MVAPALEQISSSLHTRSEIESQFFLSIFLLAYAVGPSILGPLSETYGRVRVLQIANLLYLVFNLACGFSKTTAQMLVFRFFSGIGGSAPLAIGGGVIADLFEAHERGYAVSIYSLAPLLGPAIG